MDDLVEVGYVARAHGIRGELRVHMHTAGSETLLDAEEVFLGGQRHVVRGARPGPGDSVLLALEAVVDRNAAEALKGRPVAVTRENLALDEDEVLIADLVGCRVVLEDGAPYGEIVAVEVGPQDRLVIHDGDLERQLPLVDEFVRSVDLEARTVVVAPPEGLPEERIRR